MAAATAKDPMSVKERVFIPKAAGEEPCVLVGLNGKNYNIPRGKQWEVPKPVADILYQSERAKEAAEKYIAEEKARMRETEKNPVY